MSSDDWCVEQQELEKQSFEILQQINARNQLPRYGVQYTRLETKILSSKKAYDERIPKLQQQLVLNAQRNVITRPEAERRQRLLDGLTTKSRQMENSMNNPNSVSRGALLGSNTGPGASTSINVWSDDEDIVPASHNLTSDDIRQQQQHLFREQDRGLDVLDEIITRQKYLARGIGTEIEIQNEILDDIGDNMDQTNERLIRNTRNIRKIDMKSDTCCYWIVIILLFITIFLVAFI